MRLQVQARRFFCRNQQCRRRVFAERLGEVAKVAARRTQRLRLSLRNIGLADGGERGARLAHRLGMRTSPDSLLRLIREGNVCEAPNPQVIGVDEWAKRKGQTYGTIIVDLERHRVVDLLEDATAEGFATWLTAHPGVTVISRDRGGAFAEGGREGAPDAIQIADRWHLLKNLGDAIEDYLARIRRYLPLKPPSPKDRASTSVTDPDRSDDSSVSAPHLSCHEQDRLRRRSHRLERYNAVIALHQKGVSLRRIADALDLDRQTVRKYVHADAFPEMSPRAKRPSLLDPFRTYLQTRWEEGCHNAWQLFRELKERGFDGKRSIVADAITRLRPQRLPEDTKGVREVVDRGPRRMSPRRVRWWFQGKREELDETHRNLLDQLLADHDEARVVYDLGQRFAEMLRERRVSALEGWLQDTRQGPRELKSFAKRIDRDRKAVDAALNSAWSQGQTEGQVNRLKLAKRQMYGRANFDLLKRRVLEAA